MSQTEFVKVCKTSDIPEGEMKIFNKNLIEFVVIHKDSKFHALYNKCPHMGGSLGDGTIDEDGYVTCPLHNWQFDGETGKGPEGYEDSVPAFETEVDGDNVFINAAQLSELAKNRNYLVRFDHNSKERFARTHDDVVPDMDNIAARAKWKVKEVLPMGTLKNYPKFDDILFKAAQLHTLPLLEEDEFNLKTVIGKNAKHPLELSMPVYVSHMSFGALSEEAKTALAAGTKKIGTAMCSGEGGRNQREFENAGKYIYEVSTTEFSKNEEWIKTADAVEIKIGQAAKPGLGGHLLKEKITPEIANLRGIPMDRDQISPARDTSINSKQDLKDYVSRLRDMTGGKPIAIKFAAGNVEGDLEYALFAEPDFITIDGRGGGTGAAPVFIKDNFSMPAVYAAARARKFLDKHNSDVSLVMTGGYRTSGDICKTLAMGADAVAVATSAMIAIGCQQYRTCHTGNCPVGIATQKQDLRDRFSVEESTERLVNYFDVLKMEIEEITKATGKDNVHKLSYEDLITTDINISTGTGIEHA
ncbi:glutamate synthase-related protein [Nitrosopumilus sp.]|uniref:glutamate synthase-related protein n=1 Tax=Nitrosopumilus sp. TaxID=2024843 RepID=UPI00292F468A|nr:glutamate synthase-related protein [Nitrosopumilus sp.]